MQSERLLLLELLGERDEKLELLEQDMQEMRGIFLTHLGKAADQLHHTRRALQRFGLEDFHKAMGEHSCADGEAQTLHSTPGTRAQHMPDAAGCGEKGTGGDEEGPLLQNALEQRCTAEDAAQAEQAQDGSSTPWALYWVQL